MIPSCIYTANIFFMKRLVLLFAVALILFQVSACESIIEESEQIEFFGENFVDQSVKNKYQVSTLCKDWVFVSTQSEEWEDGKLVRIKDVNNVFPYREFSFKDNGSFRAKGMSDEWGQGQWKYRYNHIFINGGYFYDVAEVTTDRLILREESYNVGGPIHWFGQDPSGSHLFYRYIYKRK